MRIETKIISAFPGTGKTYYFNIDRSQYDPTPYGYCMDSDSSVFPKENFPNNYISHISKFINKIPLIFVSSHKVVRESLNKEGLLFDLVYPKLELHDEYITRYVKRGSSNTFIKFISDNWVQFISDMENQKGCNHIVLSAGEFISNKY